MSFYRYSSDGQNSSVVRTNKCLILDLDESLIHTFDDEQYKRFYDLNLMEDPNLIDLRSRLYVLPLIDLAHTGSNTLNLLWGIYRPGLKDFLRFCNQYFKQVCIWSAGEYDYVHDVCGNIFRGLNPPTLIYTRSDCDKVGNHLKKPISKILSNPILSGVAGFENTLILDDRASTFSQNPANGVLIPPYTPHDTIEGLRSNDTALEQFTRWLQQPEIIRSYDVRQIDKNRIFS